MPTNQTDEQVRLEKIANNWCHINSKQQLLNALITAATPLVARIEELEQNIKYILEHEPSAVRVCEGGGLEDLNASLSITVANMKQQLTTLTSQIKVMREALKQVVDSDDESCMILERHYGMVKEEHPTTAICRKALSLTTSSTDEKKGIE